MYIYLFLYISVIKIVRMGLSSSQVDMNSEEAEFVKKTISDNCVAVFSKTTCGYCSMAKRVLDQNGVTYQAVELNRRSDGDTIQGILAQMTGASTVSLLKMYINA